MSEQADKVPIVGLVMGSRSDWPVMKQAAIRLRELGIAYESKVVSAHRTPNWMVRYASEAEQRGLRVIIAAAGGAAHLPGMLASLTSVPVLGVPIQSRSLNGLDSLLSIVQMPAGVPVGTLAIGEAGAINSAWLAARILAIDDPRLKRRLKEHRDRTEQQVMNEHELYLEEARSNDDV